MKLLLFGNPALEIDNLALKVGKRLLKDGHSVLHVENPLELLEHDLTESVILDVAVGVREPKLLTDLNKLVLGRLCSLHDFDMAYFLKLLKGIGKVDQVRIIALPHGMDEHEATAAARRLLKTLRKN